MNKGTLQFPLATLSMGGDWINFAVSYAIMKYGEHNEITEQEAAAALHCTIGSVQGCRTRFHNVETHARAAGKAGRCYVRMPKDLCFEARDGYGIREQDFRVLCAMRSAIGDKRYARVSWVWLSVRSRGYLREEDMPATSRFDLPTRQAIRTSLRHLKGFYASVRANHFQTFYSCCMSKQDLEEAVFLLRTREHVDRHENAARTTTLWERIKATREGGNSNHGSTTGSTTAPPPDQPPRQPREQPQ